MPRRMGKMLTALLVLTALRPSSLLAQTRVADTLRCASETLTAFQTVPLKCIPPALFQDAQGVAIIPGVVKVGFVVGGRFGRGVVLGRNPDGSWGNPVFITLASGSIGWQAGLESTDIVLVFKTRKGVERLLQGKGKLTLGAEAGVAAGPVGRQASAATDVQLKAEVYSYARSRGLFLGLALDGALLLNDGEDNAVFSQRLRLEDVQAAELLKAQLLALRGAPVMLVAPPPPPPVLAPPRPMPPAGPPAANWTPAPPAKQN